MTRRAGRERPLRGASPGHAFLFGFGVTPARNVVFIQSAPALSNVAVTPNFFDPSTSDFLTPTQPTAIVHLDPGVLGTSS